MFIFHRLKINMTPMSLFLNSALSPTHICTVICVSELMGWVRNVVLIKCIFRSGKPRGVGISGRRVYEPGEGMGKLVYEQPGNEVDGSCHRGRVPSK
jgi:hypothetical protein